MVELNKRRGEPAIPPKYQHLLTTEQTFALDQLTRFGWSLHIVRRPRFEPTEIIVEHSSGKYALLDDEGELDHSASLRLRREVVPTYEPEDTDPWSEGVYDTDFFIPEDSEPTVPTVSHEPVPRTVKRPGKPPKKILV